MAQDKSFYVRRWNEVIWSTPIDDNTPQDDLEKPDVKINSLTVPYSHINIPPIIQYQPAKWNKRFP